MLGTSPVKHCRKGVFIAIITSTSLKLQWQNSSSNTSRTNSVVGMLAKLILGILLIYISNL